MGLVPLGTSLLFGGGGGGSGGTELDATCPGGLGSIRGGGCCPCSGNGWGCSGICCRDMTGGSRANTSASILRKSVMVERFSSQLESVSCFDSTLPPELPSTLPGMGGISFHRRG